MPICLENADIAIIYGSWFKHLMPASAVEIAEWQIPNNVICGSDKVAIYALKPEYQAKLKTDFANFKDSLPDVVKVVSF